MKPDIKAIIKDAGATGRLVVAGINTKYILQLRDVKVIDKHSEEQVFTAHPFGNVFGGPEKWEIRAPREVCHPVRKWALAKFKELIVEWVSADKDRAWDAAHAEAKWWNLPEPDVKISIDPPFYEEGWIVNIALCRPIETPKQAKEVAAIVNASKASAVMLRKIDAALENGKPINHDAIKALLARIDMRENKPSGA